MSASGPAVLKIGVSEQVAVTAKVEMPARLGPETPVLILAHGANNDLDHPLLAASPRTSRTHAGTMVVRFNFPYVERGAGSPDSAPVLENTFKRVHDHVVDELAAPGAPVFIGGKSLGGRIAAELISRGEEGEGLVAAGLVELGYPLHRPGHKETLVHRAAAEDRGAEPVLYRREGPLLRPGSAAAAAGAVAPPGEAVRRGRRRPLAA